MDWLHDGLTGWWTDWLPDDRWMCRWMDMCVDRHTDGWVGWEGLGGAAKPHVHFRG